MLRERPLLGDLPFVTWATCFPSPSLGPPTAPEAVGTLEQPWAWGEESKASDGGQGHCSGDGGRRGSKGAAPKTLRGLEWWAISPPGGGAPPKEVQARGQTFQAFDLRHWCPQLEPAAPAHPVSPLPTWLLRARGARGTGPGAPRVGSAAWACHGSCCVPSRVLGWRGRVGWGGGRDEREEGRGGTGRNRVKKGERERETERQLY